MCIPVFFVEWRSAALHTSGKSAAAVEAAGILWYYFGVSGLLPASNLKIHLERRRIMKKLENLTAFRVRTGGFIWDSLPHGGGMETSPGLPQKVCPDGRMAPFGGNTVVFPLPEPARQEIGLIQDRLYQTCAPALAEPLAVSSFHITLHDLLSGAPDQALRRRIDSVRAPALARVRRIAEAGGTVRLHSTALFNMVNTSMVLGFAPVDEESCRRLMACYEQLQEVVPLNYPLTPHVTVAYFRPGTISAEMVGALRGVVEETGCREGILVELSMKTVEYQLFSDMNHYWREE